MPAAKTATKTLWFRTEKKTIYLRDLTRGPDKQLEPKNSDFPLQANALRATELAAALADIDAFSLQKHGRNYNQTIESSCSFRSWLSGENMNIRRFAQVTEENGFVTSLLHMGGRISVLADVRNRRKLTMLSIKENKNKNVAMQIAALAPQYTKADDIAMAWNQPVSVKRKKSLWSDSSDPKESPKKPMGYQR